MTVSIPFGSARKADENTYVMKCEDHMSQQQIDNLRQSFAEAMPGKRCLVLPPNVEFARFDGDGRGTQCTEKVQWVNKPCPPPPPENVSALGPPTSKETWIKVAGVVGLFAYMAAVWLLASWTS